MIYSLTFTQRCINEMYTKSCGHMITFPKDVIDYIFKLIHKSTTIVLIEEYASSYTLRYNNSHHHCSICCCTYKLTTPKIKRWGNNFIMNYRTHYQYYVGQIYSIYSGEPVAQIPKNYF